MLLRGPASALTCLPALLHEMLDDGAVAGVNRFPARGASGRHGDPDLRDSDLEVITHGNNVKREFSVSCRHMLVPPGESITQKGRSHV